MTRKQVAARLGRSLATVRRLEGDVLHPVVDANGVHQFDPQEVEALARDVARPGGALRSASPGLALPRKDHECVDCDQARDRIRVLEGELDALKRNHIVELESLRASYRDVLATSAEDQRDLESALADLLETLQE